MRPMATKTLVHGHIPRRARRRNAWAKSMAGDILTFMIGLGSCYTIQVGGDIPLCEVILIPSLLVLIAIHSERVRVRFHPFGTIVGLMSLWLLGQIATDVYRSTTFRDWSRGDANIIFFLLDFIGLTILLKGNVRRQMIFLLGIALGQILSVKLEPSLYEGNIYKFGLCFPLMYINSLICCFFYRRREFAVVGLLLLANIALNLFFNTRSVVLSMLIAAAMILPVIPERIGRLRLLPPLGTTARVLALAGIASAAAGLAGLLVTSLGASGALGREAQLKNSIQTRAGWGILIGGRPEILVSSRAVFDSPILGHGSWARDPKYSEMLSDIEAEFGMPPSDEGQKFKGLIPAHSHLMEAWVFSGFLGGVFWIYIFKETLKSIVRTANLRKPETPMYAILLTGYAWAILFSPFGGLDRIQEALILVIICDLLGRDTSLRRNTQKAFTTPQYPVRRRNLGKFPTSRNS